MRIDCTNWDAAQSEVFKNHMIEIMGGPHNGDRVYVAVLTKGFLGRRQLSGLINEKHVLIEVFGSRGFRTANGDEYYWPESEGLSSVFNPTKQPKLTVIQGGKLGRPQVWVKKKPTPLGKPVPKRGPNATA